jgi:hypothetical protein
MRYFSAAICKLTGARSVKGKGILAVSGLTVTRRWSSLAQVAVAMLISAVAMFGTAGAGLAAPVVWTLNNATLASGKVITGSFTYDSDTNAYSNINISSTGGVGPFTILMPNFPSNATTALFIQNPASPGQNGIFIDTNAKTNAGGTLTISTSSQAGLFTCTGACTNGLWTSGENFTSGTIDGAPATPVPTLSEWALTALGLILALAAAGMVQRRRIAI